MNRSEIRISASEEKDGWDQIKQVNFILKTGLRVMGGLGELRITQSKV